MHRWDRRLFQAVLTWVAVLVTTTMTVGCSHIVAGTMQRARPEVPDPGRNYGYADDQCGLLLDDSIKDAIGAERIVRPYSGAVCQYVLERKTGLVDVVFSWFDTGTLSRERTVATQRGEQITDLEIQRHPGFLAKTATACAATAAAGSGVLTWWVQFRPRGDDPCQAAQKLLTATLSSDL